MSSDDEALIEGARRAGRRRGAPSHGQRAARTRLLVRLARPLLGDRVREEVEAISSALDGVPVCGFYTYGEFARTTGSTGVHNSSVAVLALWMAAATEQNDDGGMAARHEGELASLRERLERTEQHMAQTLMRATRLAQVISVLGNENATSRRRSSAPPSRSASCSSPTWRC